MEMTKIEGFLILFFFTFILLLGFFGNRGSADRNLADWSVESQGCMGGCLMTPILLIMQPIMYLLQIISGATNVLGDINGDAESRNKAILSIIICGIISAAIAAVCINGIFS